jgi:2'-5' RNA ligase
VGTPPAWRLFIAHPVPLEVRTELHAQLAPYRAAHRDARWTPPESWHLTLLFLGQVEPAYVPELEWLIGDVGRRTTPYPVRVERVGGRISGGEGVAWLGLSTGAGRLIETATLTAERCPPEATQGRPPKRTPSAHLTLVRKALGGAIEDLCKQAHGPLGVSWTVDTIELVRSHLEASGARYETLHRGTM